MRRYSDPHPEFLSPSEVVFGRQRRVSLSGLSSEEEDNDDQDEEVLAAQEKEDKKTRPLSTSPNQQSQTMWSGGRRNSWSSLNDQRAYTHALAEIKYNNAQQQKQQQQYGSSPPRLGGGGGSWLLPKYNTAPRATATTAPQPVPQQQQQNKNKNKSTRIQRAPSPIGERMLKGDFDPF